MEVGMTKSKLENTELTSITAALQYAMVDDRQQAGCS